MSPPKDLSSSSTPPDAESPIATTRRQLHLIEESLLMEQEDASKAGVLGYMASIFVQVTLPHSDPCTWNAAGLADPGSLFFPRTTGQMEVLMRGLPRYGLPYGTFPRLILAWICTEAILTNCPTLYLKSSASKFAEALGYSAPSGPELKRLRKQAAALTGMNIRVDSTGALGVEYRNIQISDGGFLAWDDENPGQRSLWPTTLELSDKFFKMVKEQPVPIRLRAFRALSKSPMAMDIYSWLVFRMYVLKVSGRPTVSIPWARLHAQFGTTAEMTDAGLRRFKQRFILHMKHALGFYPEAARFIDTDSRHLILRPAPLHIDPKEPPRLIVG